MDALMDCLFEIPVSQVTYEEWIHIGMALKEEGYPCSVWTDWSRKDIRFHPGECERKWETFRGSGKPLRAGTIYRIAGELVSLLETTKDLARVIGPWNEEGGAWIPKEHRGISGQWTVPPAAGSLPGIRMRSWI